MLIWKIHKPNKGVNLKHVIDQVQTGHKVQKSQNKIQPPNIWSLVLAWIKKCLYLFPESSIDRGGNGERNYLDFFYSIFFFFFFIPFSTSGTTFTYIQTQRVRPELDIYVCGLDWEDLTRHDAGSTLFSSVHEEADSQSEVFQVQVRQEAPL